MQSFHIWLKFTLSLRRVPLPCITITKWYTMYLPLDCMQLSCGSMVPGMLGLGLALFPVLSLYGVDVPTKSYWFWHIEPFVDIPFQDVDSFLWTDVWNDLRILPETLFCVTLKEDLPGSGYNAISNELSPWTWDRCRADTLLDSSWYFHNHSWHQR